MRLEFGFPVSYKALCETEPERKERDYDCEVFQGLRIICWEVLGIKPVATEKVKEYEADVFKRIHKTGYYICEEEVFESHEAKRRNENVV